MWTPRRILLLLAGLFAFIAAYTGYARLLGGIDGLPQLPAKLLVAQTEIIDFPVEVLSPTDARLIEAFGPTCPEKEYGTYPTKIEMREDGIVFAAGRPQWGDGPSKYVTLAPFSVALFGNPRPAHERQPGEVTEISTLHADKGVLEFDRPVGNEKDMVGGKAKLVGVELRSDPTPLSNDRRTGLIHITNNQRSADPNKSLVFKTHGPVYYRIADPAAPNPSAPDIWTTSDVQVENRENMPRPLRAAGLPAVRVRGTDAPVGKDVVADMILGTHTPPPTVTAEGMKIYLKPTPPPAPNQAQAPGKKQRGPGFSGVRMIELSENVLMNLWTDGRSGLIGPAPEEKPGDKSGKPTPRGDPPLAASAVTGGLADAALLATRLNEKALVQIRTLGAFRFDYETNTARFEIAPKPNPLLPNHVEVTRLTAAGGRDYLVCQLLELDLDRPLTQGGAASAAKSEKTGGAPGFKAVRATGPHVYISSQADGLEAQGTALLHRGDVPDPKDPKRRMTETILTGSPLVAVRVRNRLEAGKPNAPATLTMTSSEPPAGAKGEKQQRTHVKGPGWVALFDAATNETTLRASWAEALDHDKDRLGGKDLDRFVFLGGGRFEDPKGSFDLSADTLKLWLEGGKKEPGAGGQPLPYRLQGLGHVNGKSTDAVIKNTDHLNVWFQDTQPPAPPAQVKPQVAAAPPAKPAPTPPAPQVAAAPKKPVADAPRPPQPEKPFAPPLLSETAVPVAAAPPPNPLHLSAVNVEAWVSRYPLAKGATPQPGGGGMKYDLDRARCDGRVVATQAPADPAKNPVGTNIVGATLNLDHYPAGHALTVVGTPDAPAFVQFESTTISGPHVVIDQPKNRVDVTGKGGLKMPSGTDLGGQNLAQPADLTVLWQDKMRFNGERQGAEFVGAVQAEQRTQQGPDPKAKPGTPAADGTWGRSYTLCHRLEVQFDRPIYFNQLKPADKKPAEKGEKKEEAAKVEAVVCSPAPEDGEAGRPGASVPVVFAEETFSARTGKHTKAMWVRARVLEMKSEETRTLVTASGPGESRTLQAGAKDGPIGPGTPPAKGSAKPDDDEQKLTVVRFGGKLRIDDRKGIFQEAVYEEAVRAYHVPTENLGEKVEDHALPLRSVFLRCTDTLKVTQYKAKDGGEDTRSMEAVGGAQVRDDAYVGDGHTVNYDGTWMILRGYGTDGQATLRRRERTPDRQDYKSGREIRYHTKTGQVQAVDSSGGAFSTSK